MVATTAFLAFGLLGGFAYLAYVKKRELLCYGLGAVGVGAFLDGIRMMVAGSDVAPGNNGFATFLDILHHIAFGVGGAFLAYVAVVEGWKYYGILKERRHEATLAFQAKLAAAKKPEPASERPDDPASSRSTSGKRTGA